MVCCGVLWVLVLVLVLVCVLWVVGFGLWVVLEFRQERSDKGCRESVVDMLSRWCVAHCDARAWSALFWMQPARLSQLLFVKGHVGAFLVHVPCGRAARTSVLFVCRCTA